MDLAKSCLYQCRVLASEKLTFISVSETISVHLDAYHGCISDQGLPYNCLCLVSPSVWLDRPLSLSDFGGLIESLVQEWNTEGPYWVTRIVSHSVSNPWTAGIKRARVWKGQHNYKLTLKFYQLFITLLLLILACSGRYGICKICPGFSFWCDRGSRDGVFIVLFLSNVLVGEKKGVADGNW